MIQSIPTNSGVAPGGAVGGASNLTTVGAIPYVSASGVLNQDATKLFWDSANSRLGVGTASPTNQLTLVASNAVFVNNLLLNNTINTINNLQFAMGSNAVRFAFGTTTNHPFALFTNNGIDRVMLQTTGNLTVGTTTTDDNYKLSVTSSGSTGTFRVYDQTATTGSTLAVIRAGAGQGTNNIAEFQNSSGSVIGFISSAGAFNTNGGSIGVRDAVTPTRTDILLTPGFAVLASGSLLAFASTNDATGTKDTSLSRNAAGVLEINNGTAGTYRDLLLRYLQNTGVTVATLPAAAAGNAGSRAYVTDANATTIGSTVAGGGSNKVLVWSNGTNWKIYAS